MTTTRELQQLAIARHFGLYIVGPLVCFCPKLQLKPYGAGIRQQRLSSRAPAFAT
jgi:hypothetical protein